MIIGSTFTPYLFLCWLKLILHSGHIITIINLIISDKLIECLEFDFPWYKLITCALENDTLKNPQKPRVCIIQYIKFSCTMNINHGTIHEAMYYNIITIPMKNATIAFLFEGYAHFLLFLFLGFFPLSRMKYIVGGSWRYSWTFVVGLLVVVVKIIMSQYILLILVRSTMPFLMIIHTYRFTLNVVLDIVAICFIKLLLIYGDIYFGNAIISW